ncbi:MAG: NAD-dependent epimerase/dehydratase family protein [Deltaproteobacteria bacterium]|nr:NAD-dependent epimerase/dehydratase family protein [Deltaproteobacteria bacterium]
MLITGGAGFIGVNLIRSLLPIKGVLRVLDNLSAGKAQDLDNLPAELIVADIRDRQAVDEAMAGAKIVIHLAAHTGVADSVADPHMDMSINVQGTLNLLEAAVSHKIERFIFASTGGAIVGDVDPPVHEEMSPHPVSPYGASKLAGEGYCSAFWGSYGLKTISLRFSNVYGPYSYHKGSVVAKFFRQIQAGEQLSIYGDGEQTRDFLFVKDLCQAIAAAIQVEIPYGQPIQLGTGRETSVNKLVDLMRQTVGRENFPPVTYLPTRPGEVQRNFVAISRARKYLNFSPQTKLIDGLKQTCEWFQKIP